MPSYNTEESSALLWYEQSINAGTFLGATAYGLHIATFYACLKVILPEKKKHYKWLLYICAMFILGTVNIACIVHYNELAWIDFRNYPGGPSAFLLERSDESSNVASITTSIVIQMLSGLLLIHRCHTLWRKSYIALVQCVVLLASTVISILHNVQVARKSMASVDDFAKLSFSIPSVSLIMSVNILNTLILLSRLVGLRQRAKNYSLGQDFKNIYMGYEALVVESALPAATLSLAFFILYGLDNPGAVLVFAPLVQSTALTADMIILRIIRGRAWSPDITGIALSADRRNGRTGPNEVALVTLHSSSGRSTDVKIPV